MSKYEIQNVVGVGYYVADTETHEQVWPIVGQFSGRPACARWIKMQLDKPGVDTDENNNAAVSDQHGRSGVIRYSAQRGYYVWDRNTRSQVWPDWDVMGTKRACERWLERKGDEQHG